MKPVQISAANDEEGVENEENNVGNSGNSDETTEKSGEIIRKAEKLLKISVSKEQIKTELKAPSREDTLIVPYHQRLKKNKLDNQFGKFMEIFKKLHINIPFVDALEQMPSYVKFMKDILASKRKLRDYETVALFEECSAILQRKLPPKLKDLGIFTIPCSFYNSIFEKALCDLGANINLMPLSIFRKLGLGEVNPTTITFPLVDRSLIHPRGVIEDV